MSSLIKKVAPIALSFALPGIGTALGMSPLMSSVASGAIGGLARGGGLKSALIGGLSGGAGNYLGNVAGSALGQAGSRTLDAAMPSGQLGSTLSGLKDAATQSAGGLTSALKTGIGNLTTGDGLANAASSYMAYDTQEDMKRKLLESQRRSEEVLSPFLQAGTSGIQSLQAGFDPSQLENDAGYQFRLSQGQDALERSLAARGLGSSGGALKAAQEFGQGTAAQAYNDAYAQWLARNSGLAGFGQNAAGALTGVFDNQGNIRANAEGARSNILSSALSNVLSGSAGKRIVGYDENGNPIYAE